MLTEGLLLVLFCAMGTVGLAASASHAAWLEQQEYRRRFGG
jgi:hypothetical protein